MKIIYLVLLIFLLGCSWNSDKGWGVIPNEPPATIKKKSGFNCAGENEFGKYLKGGGCNAFGCWMEGGSCNAYGCSVDGNCTSFSCPKKISSIKCIE